MRRFVGIDPSTKTGFVALDAEGNVLEAREIVSSRKEDPARMFDLVRQVVGAVSISDVLVIEGFSFGSQGTAVSIQYGIGWSIRLQLYNRHKEYIEAAPSALKKFASGKGTTKKDELGIDIFKRWGFEHKSDNVRDAYVLAQIARALHEPVQLTKFQQEVIGAIRNPPAKKPRSNKTK
jgi:crossover junction endodeoxyribonuclease RuvC